MPARRPAPTWRDFIEVVNELRDESRSFYAQIREENRVYYDQVTRVLDGFREDRDKFVSEIKAALTLHASQVDAKVEHTNQNADEALTRLESHLVGHKKIDEEAARGRTAVRVQLITTIGAIVIAAIALLSK